MAPAGLTPDGVLSAARAVLGDRAGAGIWVNVKTGELDRGVTIEVFKKDRVSGIGLLGRKTFGGALGYEFAQAGKISASVFVGAAHPYGGILTKGWDPVGGVSLKF